MQTIETKELGRRVTAAPTERQVSAANAAETTLESRRATAAPIEFRPSAGQRDQESIDATLENASNAVETRRRAIAALSKVMASLPFDRD